MHDKDHIGWTLATAALAIGMGLGLGVIFSATARSWLAFPRFLMGVLVLFIVPGMAIIVWCRLQVSRLEYLTLSIVLGMVSTCFFYVFCAWLNMAPLLYLWILAALPSSLSATMAFIRHIRTEPPALRQNHFLLLIALLITWAPMYLFPFYYDNLSWTGQGGITYSPDFHDALLHTSVAAELTHAFPPQAPFVAGEPLSYHLGMDLPAALLNVYGGVAIPDLVLRFCPTLFVTVDVLAIFCLARRFISSEAAAVVSTLLVMLGEDLSFIPGIFQSSEKIWSVQYFAAPTVLSLYNVNPMVLGQGLLFSSLFCLDRSLSTQRWGWIVAAALCSTALIETKIFVFAHLLLALLIVLALELLMFRRSMLLKPVVVIAVMSLPLILYASRMNRHGADIVWMLSSGMDKYVQTAFETAKWHVLVLYPSLGLIMYLALTFGFRVVGLGELVRSFRTSKTDSFSLLVAVFVVLGPVVTLTTKVVPSDYPESYNNSIWFMVGSKYVATLFAVLALSRLWRWLDWKGRWLLLSALLIASFASTIQYVAKRASFGLKNLPPSVAEAIKFLDREAHPGQVVLSRLDDAILGLTALRIPVYSYFAEFVANRQVVVSRREDVESFWQAWMAGTVRQDLLQKYRVDWLIAGRKDIPAGLIYRLPAPPLQQMIEQRYANRDFIVYEVRSAQQ